MQHLLERVKQLRDEKVDEAHLYNGETWDAMVRRWTKLVRDFHTKADIYDISKVTSRPSVAPFMSESSWQIPDIHDCVEYDRQHNTLVNFNGMDELHTKAKHMADLVVPQEYGITKVGSRTVYGNESLSLDYTLWNNCTLYLEFARRRKS